MDKYQYSLEEKIVSAVLIISAILLLTDNSSRILSIVWLALGIFYIFRNKKYEVKGVEIYFLIYFVTQGISVLWAKEIGKSWHEYYRHIYGIIPLFTISQIPFLNRIKKRCLEFSMIPITLYYFIYVNLQLINVVPRIIEGGYRFIGFGRGTVVKYAYVVGILLMYMFFRYLTAEKKREKISYLILTFMSFELLILSGARGAWLGIIGAMGIMGIFYVRNIKKIALGAGLLSTVTVALVGIFYKNRYFVYAMERLKSIKDTKNDESNLARLNMWKVSVEKFKESNYLGLGYKNNLKYPALGIEFDHPHSDFFYILSSSGVIGILGYLFFLIGTMVKSIRNIKKDIWLYILGVITFLSIYGVFEVLIQTYITLLVTTFILSLAEDSE